MKINFNITKNYWSKADQKFITAAVRYAAYRYGLQDIDLTIKLGKPRKKYCGFSEWTEDFGFKVWLYPNKALLLTIFHEMTHIKQFYFDELDLDGAAPRWLGKKCRKKYENQPWEIEANKMEEVLRREFFEVSDYYPLTCIEKEQT
jgi:hypothetical protein